VRFLRIVSARRVELDRERPALERRYEALALGSGQALE
jgi:hypothetical protein